MDMDRALPPLAALRSFEAAARHLSLTRAAAELCVTAAAVGHQVRALEAYFGCRLLVREGRGLVLTHEGRQLIPGLSDAFVGIARSVHTLNRDRARRVVTVSVLPSFASRWLLPRLDRFYDAYPDVDLRIEATSRRADLDLEGIDVAIRYGPSDVRTGPEHLLLEDAVYPVACVMLAKSRQPLREPVDLAAHVLVHEDWRGQPPNWPNWNTWLDSVGIRDLQPKGHRRFTVAAHAIQAVAAGHGVALANHVLVADDVAAGALQRPFEAHLRTPYSYRLVTSQSHPRNAAISAFLSWIEEEARAFPAA